MGDTSPRETEKFDVLPDLRDLVFDLRIATGQKGYLDFGTGSVKAGSAEAVETAKKFFLMP